MNFFASSANRKYVGFAIFFTTLVLLVFSLMFFMGGTNQLMSNALAAANRTTNGIFAALVTSMALIISLSANLYTPQLVKFFVSNTIIISGLITVLLCNVFLISFSFIPIDHPWYRSMVLGVFGVSALVISCIIPFLYFVSKFLRPSFIIPLLDNRVIRILEKLHKGKDNKFIQAEAFDLIDVITNIASTATNRDDKRLLGFALFSLHKIFTKLIELYPEGNHQWRESNPQFINGLAKEGRKYLFKEKIWAEAYILEKIVRILGNLKATQNEVIPRVQENLLKSLLLAQKQNRNDLIDMHIMVFNSLMRKALEKQNLERFHSTSYY